MMVLYFLVAVLLCWLLFNWSAPLIALYSASRISTGRLPAELLVWKKDRRVRFYVSDLQGSVCGYSIWAPPFNIVVFDRKFFRHATPAMIRYVVAHELAHFRLGHHRKRWFAVVSGLVLIPRVRRRLAAFEAEADVEAQKRTGKSRMQLSLDQCGL